MKVKVIKRSKEVTIRLSLKEQNELILAMRKFDNTTNWAEHPELRPLDNLVEMMVSVLVDAQGI